MKHEFDDGSEHRDPVFDGLLRERIGGESPPDIANSVAMRLARGDGAAAAQRVQRVEIEPIARPFGHRVLAAALVLLGITVVVATQWSSQWGSPQQPNGEPVAEAPAQQPAQDPRPVDPRQQDPTPLQGKGRLVVQLRVVDGHGGPTQNFTMSVLQVARKNPLTLVNLESFAERLVFPRNFVDDYYRLEGLVPGDYVVAVTADAHVMTISAPFELRDEQPALRLTVTLNRGGELTGLVTDTDGKPVAGATVFTESNQRVRLAMAGPFGEILRARVPKVYTETSTKTDEDGHYRFRKLIYGTYAVRVEHPQFCGARLGGLEISDQPRAAEVLKLEPGTIIHGTATINGEASAGIKITLMAVGDPATPPGPSWQTLSDEDGTFRFPTRLPPGRYTIQGCKPDKGNNPFQQLLQLRNSERSVEILPNVDEMPLDLAIKLPKEQPK